MKKHALKQIEGMRSFIFLGIGLVFLSWAAHPFYLSVTDLHFNHKESRFQGTIRIFTSDLEDALQRTTQTKADLLNYTDSATVRKQISGYLEKRFAFYADGTPAAWRVLGFEHEEEATWIYIEMARSKSPRKVVIRNQILCDFLPQQMNIIHVQVNAEQKSGRINCPDTDISFSF